jgi:hypothetical protein
MSLHFLFPAHPIRSGIIDEVFADQFDSIRAAGFSASLLSEAVMESGKPLRGVPVGSTVVYRGWMFNAAEYARMARAIADAEATPLTSLDRYLSTHHLPNWYPHIAEFTPETRVILMSADLEGALRSLGWEAFFIKDYVKSVKTARGSIIDDPSQISEVVSELIRLRGEIEGGLCVRRVEPLDPASERRYFVVNGRPFSATRDDAIPVIVHEVAKRIPSDFFSVDIIRRADGALRVVEVGDGQVSDLVGWTTPVFAAMWAELLPRT